MVHYCSDLKVIALSSQISENRDHWVRQITVFWRPESHSVYLVYFLAQHPGLFWQCRSWADGHLDLSHHEIENTKCLAWFHTVLGFQGPLEPKKKYACSGTDTRKIVTGLVLPKSTKSQVKHRMESEISIQNWLMVFLVTWQII